mgnify:FL=1|jgi:hypothetical protein
MANRKRGYYTLKLGGKNRTLHFSMNFWANFTEAQGVALDQIGEIFSQGLSLSAIRDLIYSALLANDQENNNEIDYNKFTVGAWLEDLTGDQLNDIVAALMETKLLGNDLNMGVERNPKPSKTTTQKKTKP